MIGQYSIFTLVYRSQYVVFQPEHAGTSLALLQFTVYQRVENCKPQTCELLAERVHSSI